PAGVRGAAGSRRPRDGTERGGRHRHGAHRRPCGRARGVRLRLPRRQHGERRRRAPDAAHRARGREAAAAGRGLGLGRRAHAGGHLLAPPDGEDRRGAGPAAHARRSVHLADDRSHHRRRGGLARPPGRRQPGRAGRAHRLRGAARHRADDPPEAAGGLPARRVPARARHARPHRAAPRAAHDARAAARPARGSAPRAQATAPAPRAVTYEETVAYLAGLEVSAGWDLKLERMRAALARRGYPEARWPALHVAGTNGKGSTAAMLDAVLTAAGYRTGLYTSPHLVDFVERIRMGGRTIPRAAVVELVAALRADLEAAGIVLTHFEFATLIAFEWFARVGIDVGVIEVGLGGRWDHLSLALPGVFQRDNAAVALTALALVRERFPCAPEAVRAGLAAVRWPGRLAVLRERPLVVVDGAHNPAGAAALAAEL